MQSVLEKSVVLLGWPALGLALVLAVSGLLRRREVPLYLAAVCILPASVYLMGSPHFRWVAFLMPYLVLGSGLAVRYRRVVFSWLLVVPPIAFYAMMAFLVLKAPPHG